MSYKIFVVDIFKKELKKLAKKYKNIKEDYLLLLQTLSNDFSAINAQSLGNNCYKVRLKNSDNHKGKSAGYRVIYLKQEENKTITLLSIYSKSDYENISEELIDKKIVEAIHKEQL